MNHVEEGSDTERRLNHQLDEIEKAIEMRSSEHTQNVGEKSYLGTDILRTPVDKQYCFEEPQLRNDEQQSLFDANALDLPQTKMSSNKTTRPNVVLNGFHLVSFIDDGYYEGEWFNNLFHGHGKRVWKDGSSCVGEWKRGERDGAGIMTMSDGTVVEGVWTAGRLNGMAKITDSTGLMFETTFVNGEQDDSQPEKYYYINGDTYYGTPENENREKKGIYTWASDGAWYEGEFRNGLREGHGVLFRKNGLSFDGVWNNDEPCGKGILRFPSGSAYYGSFFSGLDFDCDYGYIEKPDGKQYVGYMSGGIFREHPKKTYSNGNVYQGQMRNGKANGYGKLYTKYAYDDNYESLIIEGYFVDDKLKGKCRRTGVTYSGKTTIYDGELNGCGLFHGKEKRMIKYSDGTYMIEAGNYDSGLLIGKGYRKDYSGGEYRGYFAKGKYQSHGEYTWKSNDVYQGDFTDGMFDGRGIITFQSGDVFEGVFVKNRVKGHGKMKYTDGRTEEGEFLSEPDLLCSPKLNGKGVAIAANGDRYQGVWKNGVMNGKFMLTEASTGDNYICVYKNGWIKSKKKKK